MSATWLTESWGMPNRAEASSSNMRWMVVQQVPSPRSRAASMKLQALGMMDPRTDAAPIPDRSIRPSMHGITMAGTRCMFSAR